MSGFARKQKRVEARREYERFTKMWKDDLRLVGSYGKKSAYKRPTFAQWFAEYEKERAAAKVVQPQLQVPYEDQWAEQLDERITRAVEAAPERGVATIQIVGDEEA